MPSLSGWLSSARSRPPHPEQVTIRDATRRRPHYAWVIVTAAFVGLLTAQGARLSFGAFIGPWQSAFGANRGSISLISTVSFLVYGVTQPLAGRLVDRVGTRAVLSGSAALVGVGLALAAAARSPLQLALTYGLLASLGFGGASQVVASVAVTEWFTARRGLVFALVEAAYGAGQVLVVPATLGLVSTAGWRPALLVLAALAAVLAAPVMLVLLRSRPADKGLEPYGGASVLVPEEGDGGDGPPAPADRPPLSALFRRREFWGCPCRSSSAATRRRA